MSGLRILALSIAILAVLIVGVGCGSDAETGSSPEAKALLDDAFANKQAVKSGELQLGLKADVDGIDSLDGPLELKVDGPFKSNGPDKLPSLDWDITFTGAGQKLSGGLVATSNDVFVEFQGQAYSLGEDTYADLARKLDLKHPDEPLTPRQFGINPSAWLEDAKVEEGEDIGGDATRKVTGSVDVSKVVKDFIDVLDSPAVRKRLKESGAPTDVPKPSAKDVKELEDAIDDVDVEVNVDKNDVMRRFFTEVDFNAEGNGDGKDLKGKVSFEYVLPKVGGNPTITAPSDARPLKELLGGLGLGALSGTN